MFSLLAFIQRNLHFILFVLFELISFHLIINYNHKQREIFIHSSSLLSGTILHHTSKVSNYFALGNLAEKLQEENAELIKQSINQGNYSDLPIPLDTPTMAFDVIPARIVSQSILSFRNYITINKGYQDGIRESMGLITKNGVLGIIQSVSKNFSTGLSLLNTDIRISASIEGKNYFGTVSWNGRDFSKVQLGGIPIHADVSIGEKVFTNGYSTIFPKGVLIGTITTFENNRKGVFYDIEVTVENDFSNVAYAYVIKNNFVAERLQSNVE